MPSPTPTPTPTWLARAVAAAASCLLLASCSIASPLGADVTAGVADAHGLLTTPAGTSRLSPTRAGPLSGKTVVVDAGHAGVWTKATGGRLSSVYGGVSVPCYTAGATAPDGTPEHTLNYDLALRTAAALRALGASVVLARGDDASEGPCNVDRAKSANALRADLLVALHGDGDAATRRGFHLIHSPTMRGGTALQNRSLAAARAIATALRDEPMPPSNYKGTPDDPTDPRTNMAILNELTATPGVLLEVGNLANPDDWALLASAARRDALAAALARGISAALAPGR